MTSSGSLSGGVEGTWQINDATTPVLNRAVTDWHTDFWAQVAAAGLSGVASFSMELTNPPDNPEGGFVYAQRFPDGTAVTTDTGFGGLKSTQCTFNTTFRSYQQQAFKEMAAMMSAAGLTPYLQFGEFLWWFFAKAQNVGIGYASYTSPISIGTTVPHGLSTGQKVVNDGVRGNTAANGAFTITVTAPLMWPLADTAYLIPIFNGGCPWSLEFPAAPGTGTPLANLRAFDHFCLLSWPLPMPKPGSSAQVH